MTARFLAVGLMVLAAGCGNGPAPTGLPEAPGKVRLQFDAVIFDGSAHGRLIPAYGDIDRDGRTDLLIGAGHDAETSEGRLLVLRNRGTDESPDYAAPRWFHEAVPTGRIPES
jgi:hypothetical protein